MLFEKRKSVITVMLAILVIIVELFYVNYMLDRGLEDKTGNLTVIQGFPLAILPAVGAFFVVLTCWHQVSGKILPLKGRPESRERDLLVWLRAMNAALLIIAVFVVALFLPYALWSTWFWSYFGRAAGSVSLYKQTTQLWQMNVLWKYVASQNLSALFAAVVALVYARKASWIRKGK